MPQILFAIKHRVWLTQQTTGGSTINMPYGSFNSDFVIYKATDASLEFFVRDLDRKPIRSQGKAYKIVVIKLDTSELVYSGSGIVRDAHRGLIEFPLSPETTGLWDSGIYKYAVTIVNEDGTENPLYVDQSKNAIGHIELRDTNVPRPAPSTTLVAEDFLTLQGQNQNDLYQQSESVPGPGFYSGSRRNISLAFYMQEFTGSIWVEASLDETPSQNFGNWFPVDIDDSGDPNIAYTGYSGLDVFSIQGNYVWLRVNFKKDTLNTGTVDKVIVKV